MDEHHAMRIRNAISCLLRRAKNLVSVLDVLTKLEDFLELHYDPSQYRDASNDLLVISVHWEGSGCFEDRSGGI